MTLIVGGLLLGLVGLVWVMVIDLMRADHRARRHELREPIEPVTKEARHESKAA
jgi:hypothetical protein